MLVCIKCHNFGKSDVRLGLLLFFLIPCHFLVSYLIELVAAANARDQRAKTHKKTGRSSPTVDQSRKFERTWRTLRVAHCINVIAVLAITTYVVYFHIHHPLIGTTAEVHALIVCLKTASYALTNRDLRHAYLHPVRGELDALPPIYKECPYPYNITFSNLIYFWAAPTLVYQPAYPRTDKIRWGFVFKRVVEVVCLCAFIWFLSAQYAAPVLLNSLDKMHSLEYVAIFERLLKLSTISVGIWLAGFVGVFQSSMNALAEVTRFGDREFYEPWCTFFFLSTSAIFSFGRNTQTTDAARSQQQGTRRAWASTGAPGTSPSTASSGGTSTAPCARAAGATRARAPSSSCCPRSCTSSWSACPRTT